MKPIFFIQQLGILTLSCLLGACATTGTTQQTGQNKTSKSLEFPLQGCLTGAAAGGLGGAIVSDEEEREQNSIISAALGCVAGAALGYVIGQRTDQYANSQEAIESEIRRNNDNVQMLIRYNHEMEQKLGYYQKEVNRIHLAQQNQEEKQADLRLVKNGVSLQVQRSQSALNNVNEELTLAQQQYEKYHTQVSNQNSQKWRYRLANLVKEKQILNRHVTALMQLDTSIQL